MALCLRQTSPSVEVCHILSFTMRLEKAFTHWGSLQRYHMRFNGKKKPSANLTSSCRHTCARHVLSLLPFLSLTIHLLSIHSVRSAAAEPALTGSLLIISGQEALLKCMTPSSHLRNSAVPLFPEVTRDCSLDLRQFWDWGCKVTLLELSRHPCLVGAGEEHFIIPCVDLQVRLSLF